MSNNLPLWLDPAHWNAGIKKHQNLYKKIQKLKEELDEETNPDYWCDIMDEMQILYEKMMK